MSNVKQTRTERELEEKEKESDMFRAHSFINVSLLTKLR